jgi:tetratricopeptide (TPR) repeat protein
LEYNLNTMKKNIIYLYTAVVLLSTGCKKYLEQAPDQRTKLNTPDKISDLLVTAYPGGNYIMLAEAMSDNPTFVNTTGSDVASNRDAYFWKDVEGTDQDTPTYYWNSCYEAIAAANEALNAINKASDPENYTAQKGEALVARAYAHFMLVTFYSKPYDVATASTDIGIPYVTEPENIVIKQYDRKTVAYVYEQIEKDLLEGLPLIKDNYKVPAYHFTKKAAYAFASRFYLFKKDYSKVLEYSNSAFPNNSFYANLRPWFTWANLSGSTPIAQAFSAASNPGNILMAETTSWAARYNYKAVYSLTQSKLNVIRAPLGISFTAYKTYVNSSTFYFVPKLYEHFVRTSINASTGRGYVMQTLFATEEVLLNRAEANIYQGNYDAAISDFNILLSGRITGYTAGNGLTDAKIIAYYGTSVDKKQAYINAVLDLRRAEFIHEGLRWMDILRYKMPVTHLDKDGNSFTLTADDNRRQWQLPEEVILSGVNKNPR